MKTHEILALKRSGHHAMMNWVIKNLTGLQIDHWYKITILYDRPLWVWNDGHKEKDLGYELFQKSLKKELKPPKNLIINYEDTDTNYCHFTKNHKFNGIIDNSSICGIEVESSSRVIFIRDFYDNLYSRYLAIKNGLVNDCPYDENYVKNWKEHARYCIYNPKKCLKYEDWMLDGLKRKDFLLNNFNTTESYGVEKISGTPSSYINKEKKDLNVLPEKIKNLIRKDNELHYLIGALGYEYKEI